MSPIRRALSAAIMRIGESSDTARLDAELLMAFALGCSREQLLLDPPLAAVPCRFESLVERRRAGEPVAYLTGRRGFWTIELEVGPGVLIPRPDSETLLDAAVDHFAGTDRPVRILDLGTGPGTLLLAALDQWPRATGLGVDRSTIALDYARRNAARLGMASRAAWREGNWAEGIAELFDLVLANPPYVANGAPLGPGVAHHEPAEALFAGDDGLDALRRLVPQLRALIAPGGLAAVEIGFDQAEPVAALARDCGLMPRIAQDLSGHSRAMLAVPA